MKFNLFIALQSPKQIDFIIIWLMIGRQQKIQHGNHGFILNEDERNIFRRDYSTKTKEHRTMFIFYSPVE